MTDILTGALAAFAGPELVISYPIEKDTGGDLDLRFWNVEEDRDLWVRIQAKRLNGAVVKKAKNRSYGELLHRPTTAHPYQFRTLRDTPPPWIPLYMFYNHASVTRDPAFRRSVPSVSGVNLAFACDIAAELEAKLAGAKSTPKAGAFNKRLSHLRTHFFGLEALLCAGAKKPGGLVPTPDGVSASLTEQYRKRKGALRETSAEEVLRRLSEPQQLQPDAGTGRILADGPAVRVDTQLENPTITFISGRTADSRTPAISDMDTPRA